MKTITPVQLKDMLHDKEELALLDLREQGAFSKEHQLFACCIPLSHLELKLCDLVPRQTTRIVLVDQGKPDELRLAERGAERLTSWGYSSVAILEGGIEGWRTAGYGSRQRRLRPNWTGVRIWSFLTRGPGRNTNG
jgi:rhodanese-related sulfurtransferase